MFLCDFSKSDARPCVYSSTSHVLGSLRHHFICKPPLLHPWILFFVLGGLYTSIQMDSCVHTNPVTAATNFCASSKLVTAVTATPTTMNMDKSYSVFKYLWIQPDAVTATSINPALRTARHLSVALCRSWAASHAPVACTASSLTLRCVW